MLVHQHFPAAFLIHIGKRRRVGQALDKLQRGRLGLDGVAQELAAQTEDSELQAKFKALAEALAHNEKKIVEELAAVQGKPVDIGGYYLPDPKKCASVMRPSKTLNETLAQMKA